MTARSRSALIGRDPQLRELRDALAAVHSGRGGLVLLSGEPGIGKTRLAEEAEAMARAESIRVLWGRCYEMEGRPPFWPWVQILRTLALEIGPMQLAAEIDADTLPLAHLVPDLHPYLRDTPPPIAVDSESARFRLFQGVAAMLRRAARMHSLLLVVDDLHWADVTSLRLLEFLSYELAEVPIVAVGTYREIDLQRTPGAADIVGSMVRRAQAIPLAGFTREEVARFVANASTRSLSDAWATRLHEITDGNPFFLDEMLRLLEAHGGELPASGWQLPQGVRTTIKQRLQGLPSDVVGLVAAAAVAGREFDLMMLEALVDVPRTVLHEQLRPVLECGIVRPVADRPGRLRFSHALMHDAIHAELPSPRRIELHRRCGEILETRHDDDPDSSVTEIAHHFFEAAGHGYDEKALAYAERAGEQALRVLAFEEAAVQFARALHLLDLAPVSVPGHRCEVLLRLGEAANRAAQGPESVQAYQYAAALARQIGSPVQLARAAIGLCGVGSTWAQYGRHDSALVDVLREALDGLDPGEAGLRARVMARLATELHFAPVAVDTNTLSAEAVALARRTGDAATLAYTLPARLRCSNPDQREERRAIIDEILELTGGRGELAVHASVWRLSEALQAGALAEVETCRETLIAAIRELRQARDQWLIPVLHSQKLVLEGRLSEAERLAARVFEQENLTPNGRMTALVLLFLIRREQGRHGELAEGMRVFAYQSATVGAWRTNLAQLYAETGAEAAARAEIDALVEEGLPCLQRDNTFLLGAAGLAGATVIAGRPEQAAVIYRALLPYEGRNVVAASFFYLGPVSYYLGALAIRQGRRDPALCHLDAALASSRALGATPYVARSLLARAQAMEMGPHADVAAARAQRHEAEKMAEALGLKAIAAAARAIPFESSIGGIPNDERGASLRRDGDAWALTYRGRTSILKARRGLDYLARLLASPGQEIHVLDLAAMGMSTSAGSGATETRLDARAKRELGARIDDLRAELREAESHNDIGRATSMRAEIEAIEQHVARMFGLSDRDRRATGASERARAAVTKAIRAAIEQIASSEPDLAALLARAVRTGGFCCYTPLSEARILWRIDVESN